MQHDTGMGLVAQEHRLQKVDCRKAARKHCWRAQQKPGRHVLLILVEVLDSTHLASRMVGKRMEALFFSRDVLFISMMWRATLGFLTMLA